MSEFPDSGEVLTLVADMVEYKGSHRHWEAERQLLAMDPAHLRALAASTLATSSREHILRDAMTTAIGYILEEGLPTSGAHVLEDALREVDHA